MILPSGTTVAVAGTGIVRLFHNTGMKPGVHLVEITEAPPDTNHSGPNTHNRNGSTGPDHEPLDEEGFAAAAAEFLNKLSLDGTIEHLVVISDAASLAKMRKHFHRDLKSKRIGEFAMDFSRRSLEDIESLIANA